MGLKVYNIYFNNRKFSYVSSEALKSNDLKGIIKNILITWVIAIICTFQLEQHVLPFDKKVKKRIYLISAFLFFFYFAFYVTPF
jgi:hypothetical protein